MRSIALTSLVVAALAVPPALGQELHQSHLVRPADETGIGSQYRSIVAAASHQILAGEAQAGAAALKPVLDYCDAQLARSNLCFVSVSSPAQYQRFIDGRGEDPTPLEWLDMACPQAYYFTGFVLVEQRRFEQALPYLDTAARLAPYFPDALTERGAALNQLGRTDQALAVYRQAIALAEADPLAAYVLPMAWRGVGYALVEKHAFADARAAYQKSLELEPDNTLAKEELEFIEQQSPK